MESLSDHANWTLAFASMISVGAGTPRSSLVAEITYRTFKFKVVAALPSTPRVAGVEAIFRDDTYGIITTVVALLVIDVAIAKFG